LVRAMNDCITPKDRHEVAERLRRLTPSKRDQDYKPRYTDICTALGGKKGYWLGISALAERLADLIDPTCKDISKPPKDGFYPVPVFECSKCKRKHISPDYVRFCPNCGARVVTDYE
jgi:hypothetical protein